jgi:Ino eighty subunit 2
MPRLRARAPPAAPLTAPSAPTASSTRPRRGTANQSPAAAVIQRSSPEETRQSIHLTVKSSPGKLRQATSGAVPKPAASRQNTVAGKRASRSSRIVREVDSDDDEDEDEDEAEEADAMDVDDEEDEEDDVDAEGDEDEDMDAEGDEDDDIEDETIVVSTKQAIPVKPVINITKAQDSVEAKEMAMDDDDDDELSEPDSDMEEEDAEGEDEDAEGEEDDDMDDTIAPLDEEMDSDEDLGGGGLTPDVTKMTKRQRALVEEGSDGGLLALSNEAQKKKHFTAEENAMRRAEMARRRKNLSEKRNEEEKVCLKSNAYVWAPTNTTQMDTINRLLKKQPPKRGRRAEITDGQDEDGYVERANPLFVRYIQNAKGTQLGVPDEWLEAPVGKFFAGELAPKSQRPFTGLMVEEVA